MTALCDFYGTVDVTEAWARLWPAWFVPVLCLNIFSQDAFYRYLR